MMIDLDSGAREIGASLQVHVWRCLKNQEVNVSFRDPDGVYTLAIDIRRTTTT